jgi:hypothetical protein
MRPMPAFALIAAITGAGLRVGAYGLVVQGA